MLFHRRRHFTKRTNVKPQTGQLRKNRYTLAATPRVARLANAQRVALRLFTCDSPCAATRCLDLQHVPCCEFKHSLSRQRLQSSVTPSNCVLTRPRTFTSLQPIRPA